MRSSIPWTARCCRFIVVGVALLLSATAAAQRTDVLILKNGDHITGEIKKLQRGLLEFKTDHLGTLEVEWPAVARLTSGTDFEVRLDDGRRFYGTLAPDAAEAETHPRRERPAIGADRRVRGRQADQRRIESLGDQNRSRVHVSDSAHVARRARCRCLVLHR